MLERLRFGQYIGYWMNESLYEFAVLRAEQAESYEMNDIRQFIRRMGEQRQIIDGQTLQIDQFKLAVEDYKETAKDQGYLIAKSTHLAEKERKKRIRGKRASTLVIIAAAFGGFLLGSK